MRRTTYIQTLLAAVVVLLVFAAPAQAGDRQTVRGGLTTERPDTATGVFMNMRFFNPADRDAKPYSVDKVIVEAPGSVNHSAVPQCNASDAELMARGKAACPPGSKVQSGRIAMDTGSPFGVPRIVYLQTTTFNSRAGFVSLGEGENMPIRGVVRSRDRGGRVVVDYADAPGRPPPDSYSALKFMRTSGPAIVREDRAFMRTPPDCPESGRWTTRYTFIYHDGVRQRDATHAPCRDDLRRGRGGDKLRSGTGRDRVGGPVGRDDVRP